MTRIAVTEDAAEVVRISDHIALAALDDGWTLEELADTLRKVREARGLLANAERAFEAKLADLMPSKVSSDGSFEKHWQAAKTTWDDDYVLPRIASASRDERILDQETGEIEGEAEAAMRCFQEAAGISYFRVGALKKFGINVDDCREKSGGRWSIRFL